MDRWGKKSSFKTRRTHNMKMCCTYASAAASHLYRSRVLFICFLSHDLHWWTAADLSDNLVFYRLGVFVRTLQKKKKIFHEKHPPCCHHSRLLPKAFIIPAQQCAKGFIVFLWQVMKLYSVNMFSWFTIWYTLFTSGNNCTNLQQTVRFWSGAENGQWYFFPNKMADILCLFGSDFLCGSAHDRQALQISHCFEKLSLRAQFDFSSTSLHGGWSVQSAT